MQGLCSRVVKEVVVMMVNKYTLKNKHTCTLVLEGGGGGDGKELHKCTCTFMLEGGGRWSCWKTPTTLEDEHECLSLRVVGGGSDGRQPPPLKTSVSRSFSMVVLCWGVSSPFMLAAAAAAAVVMVRVGSCSCSCGCLRPRWQPQSMLAAAAAAVVVIVVRIGSHSRSSCCCWPYSWVRCVHVETSPGCHVTVSKRNFKKVY